MQVSINESQLWRTRAQRLIQMLGPTVLVLCALSVHHIFREAIGRRAFLFLYPAIFLGSLIGSRLSSVIALMVATLGVWFLFLPLRQDYFLLHAEDILAISAFLGTGLIASYFSDRIRQANVLRQLLTFQQVKESEEQFRLMAESIPQLAWMAKPDGNKFWYNQRWYDYTGTTPAEVVGWGWQKVHDPKRLDEVTKAWISSIESGLPFEMEFPLRAADGSYRWFLTRGSPVKNEEGTIIRWFGTNTDIDEKIKSQEKLKASKEQAEENAERIQSLLDSTAEGIWGVTVGGKITFVNQAAVKLFGYASADEVIGQNSHQLVHYKKADGSPYPQIECPIYKSFQDGSSVHLEDEVLWRKDGTSFFADYRSRPVFRDNEIVGAVTTFFDITERRQILADLKNAKEDAEHANKLKSEFLANMSHEIRTPLGVIMGFADLIVDSEATPEEKLQFASVLRQNGQQLSVIINDILDLSKVEAGHLNIDIETFSLVDVIREVINAFEISTKEKGLTLKLISAADVLVNVNSDRVRVSQVIWNLIGNAIKFTENGLITVSISYQKGQIAIAVQDTGIGLSEQQGNKLFKPFSQADGSITRKYGGTGLGLTLSKKLALLLGGDLSLAESIAGQAGRFLFSFNPHLHINTPRSKTDEQSSEVLFSPTEDGLQGIKILVVEDSPDNQTLLMHLLKKKGVTVALANNGLEGVEKALQGQFDMLLMDIQMPVMDGYTATQKLRDLGYRKPIVALTAHAMSEVRKKCLAVGYTDYLTKPINSNDLFSILQKYRVIH